MVPKVDKRVVQSIISRLLAHNNKSGHFGYRDIECAIENDNEELVKAVYAVTDGCADYLFSEISDEDDEEQQLKEAVCAIAKIGIHLTYKAIDSQIEINKMNDV
jgi:hypothetical protein